MDNLKRASNLALLGLKDLAGEGAKITPPLKFNKNHSKQKRIQMILAAEAKQVAAQVTSQPGQVQTRPASQAFESIASQPPLQGPQQIPQHSTPGLPVGNMSPGPQNTPGGARPGAGRPEGMTNAKAAVFNLPAVPNPAVEGGLCMAFELWAAKTKVPGVALTKEEAKELALPYSRMLSYMGYDDYIPPWAMEAVTIVWVTFSIVKAKRSLIMDKNPEAFKKKEKHVQPKRQEDNRIREDGERQDSQSQESDSLIIKGAGI